MFANHGGFNQPIADFRHERVSKHVECNLTPNKNPRRDAARHLVQYLETDLAEREDACRFL